MKAKAKPFTGAHPNAWKTPAKVDAWKVKDNDTIVVQLTVGYKTSRNHVLMDIRHADLMEMMSAMHEHNKYDTDDRPMSSDPWVPGEQ